MGRVRGKEGAPTSKLFWPLCSLAALEVVGGHVRRAAALQHDQHPRLDH